MSRHALLGPGYGLARENSRMTPGGRMWSESPLRRSVSFVTGAASVANGGGAGCSALGAYTAFQESFTVPDVLTPYTHAFYLTRVPLGDSTRVFLNGLYQRPQYDVDIDGKKVAYIDDAVFGDTVVVEYLWGAGDPDLECFPYYDLLPRRDTMNNYEYVQTLFHTPIDGTEAIFMNGIRLVRGVDYTIAGATFTLIPESVGDITALTANIIVEYYERVTA